MRSLREVICSLLYEFEVQEKFRELDAIYYWALCWGSAGSELSFSLKYNDRSVFRESIIRLLSQVCQASYRDFTEIFDIVVTCFESLSCLRYYVREVMRRVSSLSEDSRRVLRFLGKLGIHTSLTYRSNFLLEGSSIVNNIARRVLGSTSRAREAIYELISSGLLVACCWAPYEGIPHLYVVPCYAMPVWNMITV